MFSVLSTVFFQVVFIALHVRAVIFQDCGSAYVLRSVNIEGCQMRPPCLVTVGETVTVNIEFYADSVSSKLSQDVVMNINYINLRPHVTPDRCETLMCPVLTNAVSSFTSVMSVPSNVALNQRGWLQWRVYNEEERQVLCYIVQVQTQSRLQRLMRNVSMPSLVNWPPKPVKIITHDGFLNKYWNATSYK